MWKLLITILSVFVALVAYDVSRMRVPEEIKDKFTTRLFIYSIRIKDRLGVLQSVIYGGDHYVNFFKIISTAPFVAQPDQVDDGIKIHDSIFGDVPVRIYEPLSRAEKGPAVVWIHGGGWVFSVLDAEDAKCRHMAKHLNMVIVGVQYRLAPEHPYPIPFQDCVQAVTYFLTNANKYGVDPNRIAIGGDSAGGNLAAAVTLKLRDIQMKPQPKLQVLVYPALQTLDFNLPSYKENKDDYLLPKDMTIAMWLTYATGTRDHLEEVARNEHITKEVRQKLKSVINYDILPGGNTIPNAADEKQSINQDINKDIWNKLKHVMLDPYYAPLVADDLSGLPKAYVYTCEQDVLRDDGALYAHRLKLAGNSVEYYHNMAGFHGLNSYGKICIDQEESDAIIYEFIKANL